MNKKELIGKKYKFISMTPDLAQKYASDICESLDQIPGVDSHTEKQLLQEKSGDRVLHKKWDHHGL